MNDYQGFAPHPGAAQTSPEIWEFIVKDNLPARRVSEEILDATRSLVRFPHSGYERSDLTSRPLRFRTVREYLLAYASESKPLVVIAVLHGRRSSRIIAAILRGRK